MLGLVPTSTSRSPSDDQPVPPSRRKVAVVAGVVLALVVGLVVVDVTAGGHGQQPARPGTAVPAPASPPATAVPSGPTQPKAAGPVQPPADHDLTVPVVTPAGLVWSLWAGEWVPSSAAAGPTHLAGPIAAGYARTPLGSLIAAQQIGTRLLASPAGGWRTVTLAQVLPGVGRSRYLVARAGTTDEAPPGGFAQPTAFRFVSWTRDTAVVQLVARVPNRDGFQVVTLTLLWRNGDWRLQMQPDGGLSPTAIVVPSPSGFVLWGAPDA